MEKTRHYLLLREKLEATLQAGQDALYKNSDISDFAKSPVLSHSPGSSPAPDSPNQRQRELAAKVTAGPRGLQSVIISHLHLFGHDCVQQNLKENAAVSHFPLPSVCVC